MSKLVVFDWNGTLLSDTQACVDAVNHVLPRFGVSPITLKTYREHVIIPVIEFYVKMGCDREQVLSRTEEAVDLFHSVYEEIAKSCRSRKGARGLLSYLREKGIGSIILSNHTVSGIRTQLERLGFGEYFQHILAHEARGVPLRSRNKGDKLKDFLEKESYQRDKVILIGDTCEEVEIGKTLGVCSVAIANGFYSRRRLQEAKPDFLIDHLGELVTIVERA